MLWQMYLEQEWEVNLQFAQLRTGLTSPTSLSAHNWFVWYYLMGVSLQLQSGGGSQPFMWYCAMSLECCGMENMYIHATAHTERY